MKRSVRMIGLAALLATAPAMASAQTARPVTLGVSGGISLPMGDLDGYASGFNVTGHIGFMPSMFTNLGFRVDVSYDQFGIEEDIPGVSGNLRALGVSANAVYMFPQANPGMVRPYVLGGVGMWNYKATIEPTLAESESQTKFGAQGGAGVNFALAGFNTFLEAKYVYVSGEGGSLNWIPITFGIRF